MAGERQIEIIELNARLGLESDGEGDIIPPLLSRLSTMLASEGFDMRSRHLTNRRKQLGYVVTHDFDGGIGRETATNP